MFSIFYENEKRMRALKFKVKIHANGKKVVSYLNFFFDTETKTKFNHKLMIFVFQFIKNMNWQFGNTD